MIIILKKNNSFLNQFKFSEIIGSSEVFDEVFKIDKTKIDLEQNFRLNFLPCLI